MSGKGFYLTFGLLLCATAGGALGAESGLIIDPHLIGWWPFEEGQGPVALDASGHGNHAMLIGDPQWVPGYDGLALDLDGQGDYLDTGKLPSQLGIAGSAPRTVALWVYARSFNGGGLYEMGGHGTREGFSLRTGDIDDAWQARYGGIAAWQARYGGIDANFYTESLNEWVHLTHVYEASRAEMYVNGYYPTGRQLVLLTSDDRPFRIGICDGVPFDGLIDDVRVYDRAMTRKEVQRIMYGSPFLAAEPQPADGAATDIAQASVLRWSAGAMATGHDVYFGTDEAQVADATPQTPDVYRGRLPGGQTEYTLADAPPDWNAAYWWRVDEIGFDGTVSKGKVWSFTTANHLIIDDFESYTDDIEAGEAIFDTWCDGWYNGTGSIVGYLETDWLSPPVRSGRQAMPFTYDNTISPWYSEAFRVWEVPQDWTRYGVDTLTLYFLGRPLAFLERADGSILVGGYGSIGKKWDYLRFVYKPLDRDGSITARIDSVAETDPNAKAGVMIRWGLESDSTNVALFVTAGNGISFQYRREVKGSTERMMLPGPVPPYWLRLSREGATVVAECSADGASWRPVTDDVNASSIEMPAGEAFIGLTVATPGSNPTNAEFSSVYVAGSDANEWQLAGIGSSYEGNHSEPMYVELVDEGGHRSAVIHTNPMAVNAATWQRWDIPLSEFVDAGIDVTAIVQMIVGVGDRDNPAPAGNGMVHFDDFWLTRSTAPPPDPTP
ncbi:MAG: LamG-like jellyroll fold domain-containing protein [Sedimentisphaerales bacterium]|jgi:hypothetical protein|nr:LamG-like jellyroll fold domain-containing protein [Sedimentisphaerales bacterium]